MPLVSAILVVTKKDKSSDVRESIASILNQSLGDFELVVVDGTGGQFVESLAESLKDERIKVASANPQNRNLGALLNQAVRMSSGELIARVGADCTYAPKRLELQADLLQTNDQLGLAGIWCEFLSRKTGEVVGTVQPELKHKDILRHLLVDNHFVNDSLMYKRECYEAVGGYDESLQHATEYDFSLRASEKYVLANIEQYLCQRRTDRRQSVTLEKVKKVARKRLFGGRYSTPRDVVRKQGEIDFVRSRFIERMSGSGDYYDTLKYSLARYPCDSILYDAFKRTYEQRYGDFAEANDEYCFLKMISCLRFPTDAQNYNDLTDYFSKRNNPHLSFLCSVRSLEIDPGQSDVFLRVKGYKEKEREELADFLTYSKLPETCTVSVVMPTYNRTESIRESIESVLGQTFDDLELVIINDGGTDEVEHIVGEFGSKKIKYYKCEHKGLAGALNEGLRRAEGRYVSYIDDDDIYYPSHVEQLLAALRSSNEDIGLVYSKSRLVKGHYENGRFVRERELGTYTEKFSRKRLHEGCIISTLNVMHKRDALEITGLFNEYMPWSMDWDLWVRFSDNFGIRHLDEFTGEYRLTDSNMTVKDYYKASFYISEVLSRYYLSNHGLAILAMAADQNGDKEAFLKYFEATVSNSDVLYFSYIRKLLEVATARDNKATEALVGRLIKKDPTSFLAAVMPSWRLMWRYGARYSLIRKIPQILIRKDHRDELARYFRIMIVGVR